MKSPINPTAFSIGLAVVGIGLGFVFWMQRGAHMELKGSVLKVRTQAMDENSSVAVVDFRFANPAGYPFMVKQVDVILEGKDGKRVEGETVAESDVRRLFQYYKLLGEKYNDSLLARTRIPAKQSMDRMICARFELPEEAVQNRRRLIIRITDVDGPTTEIEEARL
jgi:hypothetical protein